MKLDEIKNQLTWRSAMGVNLRKIEGFGLLLRDDEGDIFAVGDYILSSTKPDSEGYCIVDDAGCGCCADQFNYIEYAFLSEYIENKELEYLDESDR